MFVLPDLPYAYDALKPVISDRTLRFHHDKHHAAYVKTTNELLEGKPVPDSLESVIQQARASQTKKLFNNAAQAWNHGFFWVAMTDKRETPNGALADAIAKAFGDLKGLREKFVTEGAGHFGSGWVWLIAERGGALAVKSTHDADDFVSADGATPLIVCDLWEHAYYLDHQNDRKGFLEAWFDALPDWTFAGRQLAAARGDGEAWRYPAPQAAPAQARAG
ncbi:MAG TPA: superoxide dismutase [Caulobacteraceae bacterium]|jgi:Fe-Mn family superoxide dismutase